LPEAKDEHLKAQLPVEVRQPLAGLQADEVLVELTTQVDVHPWNHQHSAESPRMEPLAVVASAQIALGTSARFDLAGKSLAAWWEALAHSKVLLVKADELALDLKPVAFEIGLVR